MTALASSPAIVQQLRKELLQLERHRLPPHDQQIRTGLGSLEAAFPERTFPLSAIHEFLTEEPAAAAATTGFITAVLGSIVQEGKCCLWIGRGLPVYPPALRWFGISPDRIIFIQLQQRKELLWAIEEGLKCNAVAAVVGELSELSFTESRRLQLAVEQSNVTGFIHRYQPRQQNTVACLTRWKIRSLPSLPEQELPGVGFPRWEANLLKVKNGRPGVWQLEWTGRAFREIRTQPVVADNSVILKTA